MQIEFESTHKSIEFIIKTISENYPQYYNKIIVAKDQWNNVKNYCNDPRPGGYPDNKQGKINFHNGNLWLKGTKHNIDLIYNNFLEIIKEIKRNK